jgi:hypothetical protein
MEDLQTLKEKISILGEQLGEVKEDIAINKY